MKLLTFLKSVFFPDLYDEELRMKNKVGLNTSHRIEQVGGGTYNIPGDKQKMVTLAIKRAGLDKAGDEGNAVGFGINISTVSKEDKEFLEDFEKLLDGASTQEEFDALFRRIAAIVKEDGYVASDLDGEDPRDALLAKLRARKGRRKRENPERGEGGGFSPDTPELGDPDAIPEENKILFKDTFIATTLEFFEESPLLRVETDMNEEPFLDLQYLPSAMKIESGREAVIVNTLVAEYIESGDILRCSKAVFDLGLNYAETHFGGIMIGYLQGLTLHVHVPDELPDNQLNTFFGRQGLRRLKRIGIAYGLKAHLPTFDKNEFDLEMTNFLSI